MNPSLSKTQQNQGVYQILAQSPLLFATTVTPSFARKRTNVEDTLVLVLRFQPVGWDGRTTGIERINPAYLNRKKPDEA